MPKLVCIVLLVLVTLGLLPAITQAQNVASITGVATDASDAVVPGASVKLVDTRTGTTYFAKTAGDGGYRIVDLAPGPGYSLTVKKDGFQTLVISNLYLPVATTTTQDVKLQLGAIDQTVTVTAQGSITLDTTNATIGNTFDMRTVEDLPLQIRDNPAALLQLQPGVTPTTDVPDDPLLSRGGAVTGARSDQNNILVDGIDAQDFAIGEPFALVAGIPVEAVQEFRTDVANPVSDTGRGSGATTYITTRSGTDQWHGIAQEWNRTALTEANSFFNQLSGVPRQQLIRNQFGGNLGGPVKKDKLFFFFDYDGRRDRKSDAVLRIVPLANITALATNGPGAGINYINDKPGCDATSRLNTTPQCITLLSPTGACGSQTVQGLDPLCTGADSALTSFIAGRYPAANDMTQGDGVNTGGLRFNAPAPLTENIYLGRIDYTMSSKHKLFARFNFNNQNTADDVNNASAATGIAASKQFPKDPISQTIITADKAWVVGDTWTISPNTVNQFVYGESRNQLSFESPFAPNGTIFQFSWMNGSFDAPYLRQSTQARIVPIPTFRDDWTQTHGSHTIAIGGVFKPIRTRDIQVNDFNFVGIGIGQTTPTLDATLRPSNILPTGPLDPSGVAAADWDNMFMGMLGSWWLDIGLFNYLKNGTALPNGAPHKVYYRYYEYEGYAQDSWRVRNDLTFTYGLRYQYDSVPYETNGIEGIGNLGFNSVFAGRVADGAAGTGGIDPALIMTYTLGGKANPGGPSLYKSDPTNFSPRFAVAWNPSFHEGFLGKALGDRKTVFRGGAQLIYDHTALNSINFIQDQSSQLFSSQNGAEFPLVTSPTPEEALSLDPRFTGINDLPVSPLTPPVAPPFTNPFTPFVEGVLQGATNYSVDPNFKTPYADVFSVDMQREIPGNMQLELGWVGRYAHRLVALADAGQLVDFNDAAAGQTLFQAITGLESQARASGATAATVITPEPMLEDPAICGAGCSQVVYSDFFNTLKLGGLGNVVNAMTLDGFFNQLGIGLSPQFADNLFLTNKGWSNYNGLLVTLRKRFSDNLQADFNYTYAHSLDDISIISNNIGNQEGTSLAVLCDVRSEAVCKGNSEFDLTNSITADGIYNLPFGRGQRFGKDSSVLLDELIGGWSFSGTASWHTGFPFNPFAGVSTTSLLNDSLAIFDGNKAAISTHIHETPGPELQLFANPAAAAAAFSSPTGQQVGSRNVLRGPHFSNFNMALVKNFNLGSERYHLQLRMEAYNAFNHSNFALPDNVFTSPLFGVISTTAADPREMQFALRFEF
ncbi:MAG TPA: carboxypeptidase-like regulatory domain-containing protein [Candidatus Acidoferrum sp.]|nr:carboxypeptidase-like regulatory domain-containing protein [Candidatus Acidoferrum sp.]